MKVMVGAFGALLVAGLAAALFARRRAVNLSIPLEQLPKKELYARAQQAGVDGRSRMTKAELVTALQTTA